MHGFEKCDGPATFSHDASAYGSRQRHPPPHPGNGIRRFLEGCDDAPPQLLQSSAVAGTGVAFHSSHDVLCSFSTDRFHVTKIVRPETWVDNETDFGCVVRNVLFILENFPIFLNFYFVIAKKTMVCMQELWAIVFLACWLSCYRTKMSKYFIISNIA